MTIATYDEAVTPSMVTGTSVSIALKSVTNYFSTAQPLTRPASIPSDELFYWSQRWQADEQQSIRELANGESYEFESSDDAIKWLLDPTSDD